MGAIYKEGETKVRPGTYRMQEDRGFKSVPAGMNGVFCIPVHADWGPVGTVTTHTLQSELDALYGTGGTVDAADALFDGGATMVYVYRLGTGGEKGILRLKDEVGVEVVTLSTRYESEREFSITVREKLGSESIKEFIVYEGTKVLETLKFEADENEIDAFSDKVNGYSSYFTAVKNPEVSGNLEDVTQKVITKGVNPTVTNGDYGEAFAAFEAFKWNVLALDTISEEVHTVAHAYVDRIYEEGALGVAVIGKNPRTEFVDRLTYAKGFNDEKVICLGSGYIDKDGNMEDGYKGFALQAGIIGSTPSNESVTHKTVPGAVDTLEPLKGTDYEKAIGNGLLLLSQNDDGLVWFDSGINTLTVPREGQDDGWKKIRRTSTRFEMFDRIGRVTDDLVGRVNCDNIGINDVVKAAKKVLEAMYKEGKLLDGATFYEDPMKPHGADYAYFIIEADDADSLEKIYLRYRFRFTAE